MKKSYIFLTLLFIILLSFSVLSNNDIYLGSYSPKKEIDINFSIKFSDNNRTEQDIIIKFKNEVFKSNNSTISNSRITSNLRTGIIKFQNEEIIISSRQLQKEANNYILPIKLKLFPHDKPGVFENTIMIKNSNGEILFEKTILFKVDSWTIFELSKDKYLRIVNSDYNNQKLKSNGEVIIKVASNSNWELYGLLNEEANEVLNKINLFIKQDNNFKTVKKGPFQIHSKSQLITQGTSTVTNDNYWEEIEVIMEIEDIKNIKSGLKIFPVIFYLYSTI